MEKSGRAGVQFLLQTFLYETLTSELETVAFFGTTDTVSVIRDRQLKGIVFPLYQPK